MAEPEAGIETLTVEGVRIIRALRARLNSADVQAILAAALDPAESGALPVVLDLTPVDYANSMMVAAIVRIGNTRRTVLAGVQGSVAGLLQMMGAFSVVERATDESTARRLALTPKSAAR